MGVLSSIFTTWQTWHWLPVIGALCILAIATQMAYNLFLHPLAKVPGPILARVSGIPSWYHAICGDRHIWIWQLNQIYGARVRIDPITVIFFDPTSYNEIYSNSANVQRSRFYTALQRSHHERNTLTTVDTQLHAQKRKLLNLSFTEKSLRAASGFMITHIDRWIELIAEECKNSTEWTAPKDFAERAKFLVFDIMGDLCFGSSPNIKEPGENPFKSMPHNIATYLKFWYPITRSPFLGLILWLRPRGFDALMAKITPPGIKAYYQFVHDSINKRSSLQEELREKPESQQRHDMFHFLRESKNPDTDAPAYTQEELWAEANMLIIAGADTTAVSLCGIFFYLVHDEIRLKKLTYEIRSTFVSANEIVPGQKLQSCIYLRACIDEGMRLTPAGPSETGREIKAGGAIINGEHYPAGTVVGVAAWAQTRNEVYRDPLVFRPERWIVDTANGVTEENISLCRNNFHFFGRGPGSCPGKNMALLEMMLTVAKTLHCLDVRKAAGGTLGEGSPDQQWGQRDRNILQMQDAYISILRDQAFNFGRGNCEELCIFWLKVKNESVFSFYWGYCVLLQGPLS